MAVWPDIDVETLQAGPYIDRLVAEKVLGWHAWECGEVKDARTFVVNPVTRAIERCMPWLGDLEYPECSKSYQFSANHADALEVLVAVPFDAITALPVAPVEVCRRALRWTQQQIIATDDAHENV